MSMFTLQTLGLVLVAGLIGILIGWLLRAFFCKPSTSGSANLAGSANGSSINPTATAAAGVAAVAATAAVASTATKSASAGSVSGAIDTASGAIDTAASTTSNVSNAAVGGIAGVAAGAAALTAAASSTSSSIAQPSQSRAVSSETFFSCNDIHSYYGESYIIQGVSFEVKEGEIIALLGRNGAGKTTTLRSIARADDPQLNAGEIWLDGKPLHEMKAHEAAQLGVALVPEDRRIIPGLTVHENLQIAQIAEPIGWDIERIYDHFPRLRERKDQEGITLSGGEQQMLAVARALARDIKLLLLDEPYEGLAPVIVKEIEGILQNIKELGITTILVEQNAVAALRLADRAIILDTGLVVFDGTAQEVLDNEQLINEYLAI